MAAFVVTAGVLALRPTSYLSTAQVSLDPDASVAALLEPTYDSEAQADRLVANEIVTAKGADVARAAAGTLGRTDVRQLRRAVTIKQVPNTDIIAFAARQPSARSAQAVANAWADAYLDVRAVRSRAAAASATRELDQLLDGITTRLAQLDQQLNQDTSAATAEQMREVLGSQYQQLLERRQQLAAGQVQASGARVLARAERPTTPAGPHPVLWGLVAAAFAAGLGAVIVATREQLNPRIHGPRDVEGLGGTPLAVLPAGKRRGTAAYWSRLRCSIAEILLRDDRPRVVTVLAAGGGGVAGVNAASIAIMLAEAGLATALVSSRTRTREDLQEVVPESLLARVPLVLGGGGGNQQWALGGRRTSPGLLGLVPTDDGYPAVQHDLSESTRTDQILSGLRAEYDAVVIDSPSLDEAPQARAFAALSDLVILVVALSAATVSAAADDVETLHRVTKAPYCWLFVRQRTVRGTVAVPRAMRRRAVYVDRPPRGPTDSAGGAGEVRASLARSVETAER